MLVDKLNDQCEISKIPLLNIKIQPIKPGVRIEYAALNYFKNLGYTGYFDEGSNLQLILWIFDCEKFKKMKYTELTFRNAIDEEVIRSEKIWNEALEKKQNGEKVQLWKYKKYSGVFCHQLIDAIGYSTFENYALNLKFSPVGYPDLTLLCDDEIILYEVKSARDCLTSFQMKNFPILRLIFPLGVVRVQNYYD